MKLFRNDIGDENGFNIQHLLIIHQSSTYGRAFQWAIIRLDKLEKL